MRKTVRPGRLVDVDGAAVVGHDAVRDREAEARALRLGREERVEDRRVGARQAGAVVLDLDDAPARGWRRTRTVTAPPPPGAVASIAFWSEVQEHLLDLGAVDVDRRGRATGQVEGDWTCGRVPRPARRAGRPARRAPAPSWAFVVERPRPREVEELAHERGEAVDLVADDAHGLERLGVVDVARA